MSHCIAEKESHLNRRVEMGRLCIVFCVVGCVENIHSVLHPSAFNNLEATVIML